MKEIIISGTNPERYAVKLNGNIILLQVCEEEETITIIETKNDNKVIGKVDVLEEQTFDEFDDNYNCVSYGAFDFKQGFRNYLNKGKKFNPYDLESVAKLNRTINKNK